MTDEPKTAPFDRGAGSAAGEKPSRTEDERRAGVVGALFSGVAGQMLCRPWLDRVTLRWVAQWYFPLSRAWAAAEVAADGEELCERLGLPRSGRLLAQPLVTATRRAARRYRQAEARWREAFFDLPADTARDRRLLSDVEEERRRAAHLFMACRSHATPLHLRHRLPAVRFKVPKPDSDDLEMILSERAAPSIVRPRVSHRVLRGSGLVSEWLRWPSPLGDEGWARVFSPPNVENPPTLIYLHGLGMEPEMWRDPNDPVIALARRHGLRIIRPEAPWHGRRRPVGSYGGEPMLAGAPIGQARLLQSWVDEVASLVSWARATSSGRLALGGLSLGALTAQRYAVAACDWPDSLRPDSLFLMVTSGDLVEVGIRGSLARALGVPEALSEAGWREGELEPLRAALEPQGAPCLLPQRIVMLLGSEDTVTPFTGGMALAQRWRVPKENLFLRPQGHFTVPLGLHSEPEPLDRLVEVLRS